MKRKYHYLVAILCILSAIFYIWLRTSSYPRAHFPIRHVIVEGEYWQVPQPELESIIASYAKSGYFLISLSSLQHQLLEKEPWLQTVAVSRQWPDTLVVVLQQKNVIAVLNQHSLVTPAGDVFSPPRNSFPPDLLNLVGSKEHAVEMLQYYQLFTSIAHSANLTITELKLTAENNWSITLCDKRLCEKPQNMTGVNNKIVVMLGENDILIRFKRFIKVYQQVFVPEHREPSYVDMRYSHGMAVNWAKI